MKPSLQFLLERIGKNMYRIRHERNEKLYTVAHCVHVSVSVISQIENGRYKCLSFDLLTKIADYYEKNIDDILLAQTVSY